MRLALALLVAAGLTPVYPSAAAACDVTVSLPDYAPDAYTIEPGESVTWCWTGDNHSVTGAAFDSGVRDTGATFARTFAAAGTYAYHCVIHSSMVGSIKVVAPPSPSPTSPKPTTHLPATHPPTTTPTTATTPATRPPAVTRTPTPAPTTTAPAPPAPPSTLAAPAATPPPAAPVSLDTKPAASSRPLLLAVLAAAVLVAIGGGAYAWRRR